MGFYISFNRRDYADEVMYKTNKHGDFIKKNAQSAAGVSRCDDGLDNMIAEYAKKSPIVKSFCGEKEFNDVLNKCKNKR